MKDYELKLKDVRKNKKLTQNDLAKKLNVPQQRISEYETGTITPSLDRLIELAQILDVTLDELIEFKKIHTKYSKELSNITKK